MRRAGIALLATLMLAGCNAEPEGEPVMRTEIGSGVADPIGQNAPEEAEEETPEVAEAQPKQKSICKAVTFEETKLTHCIVDPKQHRISTDLGPDGGAPYRSLKKFAAARPPDAAPVLMAMNAGMFDKTGEPIGYYVEERDRLVEINRNDGEGNFHLKPNGIFFGTGGKWRILDTEDFYSLIGDRPDFATQSGPMLVKGGMLHPEIAQDGPSKVKRNGVGVDAQGRAHFVISEAPLSFGRLARYFRDEIKVKNALFLDGNVSALWDPAQKRMDTGAQLGPLIVVEARAKESAQ